MDSKERKILKLRMAFCKAYKSITRKNIPDDLFMHKSDAYYDPIRIELRTRLKRTKDDPVASNDIIRKFLSNNENFNYYESTLKIFKDYIEAVKNTEQTETTKVNKNPKHDFNFKGCILIDEAFKKRVSLKNKNSFTDFYLGKQDNYCQWYGIVNGWDDVRDIYKPVRELLTNCFIWESRITSVIYGSSGNGKSTFLRRLAVDCIFESYKILWISDLSNFYEIDLKEIVGKDEKFLVFLDDWEEIECTQLGNLFLKRLLNTSNVRLVLGDHDVSDRSYYRYVVGGGFYELSNSDNDRIVNHIISTSQNSHWQEYGLNLINSTQINNAPIFIIVFLIIRATENHNVNDIIDVTSRFEKIIKNDQKKIKNKFPGLSQAFVYITYAINLSGINVSWRSFLNLANFYNNSSDISFSLLKFDLRNPICKILSHYFSLEDLYYPGPDESYLKFHHQILISEIMKLNYDFIAEEDILADIIRVFINLGDFAIAKDLAFRAPPRFSIEKGSPLDPSWKEQFESMHLISFTEEQFNYFCEQLKGHFLESFSSKVSLGKTLKELYSNALLIDDEKYWEKNLRGVINNLVRERHIALPIIFKKLINNGCKAKYVKRAYELSLTSEGCDKLLIEIGYSEERLKEYN